MIFEVLIAVILPFLVCWVLVRIECGETLEHVLWTNGPAGYSILGCTFQCVVQLRDVFDRTAAVYCVGLTCHFSWRHTLCQNTKLVLLRGRNWELACNRQPVMYTRWTQDIWQIRTNRRVTLSEYHSSNMCCALLVMIRIYFWFEALAAVTVKITAFRYVTPCSLLELSPYSGGTCGLTYSGMSTYMAVCLRMRQYPILFSIVCVNCREQALRVTEWVRFLSVLVVWWNWGLLLRRTSGFIRFEVVTAENIKIVDFDVDAV